MQDKLDKANSRTNKQNGKIPSIQIKNAREYQKPADSNKMNHASSVLSEDPKNIKLEENVKNMIGNYKQASTLKLLKVTEAS